MNSELVRWVRAPMPDDARTNRILANARGLAPEPEPVAGLREELRPGSAIRCPWCRGPFAPSETPLSCDACSAPYHRACIDEAATPRGACLVYACPGSVCPQRGAPPRREPVDTVGWGALVVALGTLAIVIGLGTGTKPLQALGFGILLLASSAYLALAPA